MTTGKFSRRQFMKAGGKTAACFAAVPLLSSAVVRAAQGSDLRLGMIGLDTSHVVAFAELINNPESGYGAKVVAAYPGGSPDIPSSWNRVEEYSSQLREKFGVRMVDSIEGLCAQVDAVLLESVDGRPHLAQAKPVIAAKKPLFIDKPMAGSLEDVVQIFRLARESGVLCWSSSSLRYTDGIKKIKSEGAVGDVLGCDAFSPCSLEEHHPDLYWYGVHGVEMLYALMGRGCKTVRRTHTRDTDFVTGVWDDDRIGTFRGLRAGKHDYGAYVFGSTANASAGGYTGYKPLVDEFIKCFKTGEVPVPPEETVELFAFMTAADVSKYEGGREVYLKELILSSSKS